MDWIVIAALHLHVLNEHSAVALNDGLLRFLLFGLDERACLKATQQYGFIALNLLVSKFVHASLFWTMQSYSFCVISIVVDVTGSSTVTDSW